MVQALHTLKRQASAVMAGLLFATGILGSIGVSAYAATGNGNIVISQVYGGGGNSGAPYQNDFVELYNPTDGAIDLEGWSLEYTSASGTWGANVHTLTAGSVSAGGYYLIKEAAGANASTALPSPDQSGGLALGAANGKIRLKNAADVVVDLVGYGTANEAEGGAAVAALSNTAAAIRKELESGGRGLDTDVNANDFTTGAPDPRNSSYGIELADVTASPEPGAVASGTEIVLSTSTSGAEVFYRLSSGAEFGLYTAPIAITGDTAIEAYAKKGLETTGVRTFTYTVMGVISIAEARTLAVDSGAVIEGVVTYKETSGGKNNLYVQDGTAGIVVRGTALTPGIGDKIQVSGTIVDYFGLAELETEAGNVTIVEQDAGVPEPEAVTGADLTKASGEPFEARYVQVTNVTAGESNAFNEFTMTDSNGAEFIVKSAYLESGVTYEAISGVVTYSYGNYMIIPRSKADIVEKYLSVLADPSSDAFVKAGTAVALATPAAGGAIYYTTDGSDPTAASALYSGPITIDADTTVKAIVVKNGETSGVYTFRTPSN